MSPVRSNQGWRRLGSSSGGTTSVEAARGPEVGHRRRASAQRIQQQAQVVVPVGEVGVGGKGPMVRRDRLLGPTRLLEQPAEVEVRDGIARGVLDRGTVV